MAWLLGKLTKESERLERLAEALLVGIQNTMRARLLGRNLPVESRARMWAQRCP